MSKKEIWIFATYQWQGNPKALYLYMRKNHSECDIWWLADTNEAAKKLKNKGIKAFCTEHPDASQKLSECDVFVTENIRIRYPKPLNPNVRIINLWHGVGIKFIEYQTSETAKLYREIAKKHITNAPLLKRNQMVLVTSEKMEAHFKDALRLRNDQVLRGVYPRNVVYKDRNLREVDLAQVIGRDLKSVDEILLFAPTWRAGAQEGIIKKLIPDIIAMNQSLKAANKILIFKAHPFIERTNEYMLLSNQQGLDNIVFWPEDHDIYEVLVDIDTAIVDYSSIFYDLLDAGVANFIRYIPDYDQHIETEGLIGNYFEETTGKVARNYAELIDLFGRKLEPASGKSLLVDRFFGYRSLNGTETGEDLDASIENLITGIRGFEPQRKPFPTLYSFDVFDTLIRRKTLSPISVFHRTQELLSDSGMGFDPFFIRNYIQIRRDAEHECRVNMKATTHERGTTQIEISFDQIFNKMQLLFELQDEQISFLKRTEVSIEFEVLEVHPKLHQLKALLGSGETVVLISDMYLPRDIIVDLLMTADPILGTLPLYLSSEVGHKKDTGDLYLSVFYDRFFDFERWVHFGDNYASDGKQARLLGIESQVHDIDHFTSFEGHLVKSDNKLDTYRIATLMQRYRWAMLDKESYSFNSKQYFAYAYIGAMLVPYVAWALRDAIARGYQTLYFVSRDGYFLKQIADVLIAELNLGIKSRYIYGSRKVWRYFTDKDEAIDLFQAQYGPFGGAKTLEEMAAAVGLTSDQIVEKSPELYAFKNLEPFNKSSRDEIVSILVQNKDLFDTYIHTQQQKEALTLSYLEENIDLDEAFGIVECWGRGVTQGYLAKLLAKIVGKDIETPFYYVRSIWESEWPSTRHRFSHRPFNFNFVEPIFAMTPYASIAQYAQTEDRVSPVIVPIANEFHDSFTLGLTDFARDFSRTKLSDPADVGRSISNTTFDYLLKNKTDQYVCDIYGELFYAEGAFSEAIKYAQAFEPEDIEALETVPLAEKTRDLRMSFAKTTKNTRDLYVSKMRLLGRDPKVPPRKRPEFPITELTNRIPAKSGDLLRMLKGFTYFEGPTRSTLSAKRKGQIGEFVPVRVVDWNRHGLPMAWSGDGYVSLHESDAEVIKDLISVSNIPVFASIEAMKTDEVDFELPEGSRIEDIFMHFDPEVGDIMQSNHGFLRLNQDAIRTNASSGKEYLTTDVSYVLVKKGFYLYGSPEFTLGERVKRKKFWPGMVLSVYGFGISRSGVPRLKLKNGFVTANINFVKRLK